MPNLNKSSVPVAQEHKTKLDLSFDHVTSQGFMRLQPVGYRHMIAGERVSITPHSVVRPAPIEVPFFGSLVQNIRLFFVPYRLAFPQFDSFIGDTIGVNQNDASIVSSPPILSNSVLLELFLSPSFHLMDEITPSDPGDSNQYDILVGQKYYMLKVNGRRFMTLLESLGYRVLWAQKENGFFYNALALLSFLRVYIDWYSNHNYLNTSNILACKKLLAYNDPSTPLHLTAQDVYLILSTCVQVNYDNEEYLTAAWDNPVSPVVGQFTSLSFSDPSSTGGAYVQTNTNGTPEMVTNVSFPNSVGTTYIHEALKKLTDYQKRHALSGALEIDRLLTEHGFASPYQKLMRSTYIGSTSVVVETGSVMATAAGSSADGQSVVGDYAGAGFGKSDGKSFDFTCSEDGFLLILSSIVPVGSLVQGYDRNNRLLSKEQFFNAGFDSLGMQAIEKGECYTSDHDTFAGFDTDYAGVFGFTGQYGEKKRPKSFLTGDMRWPAHYAGGGSWHLFRLFKDSSFSNQVLNISHSLEFTKGGDASQYHRVFQAIVSAGFDPFYCFMHFDMVAWSPCKPLFDTYEFDSTGQSINVNNGSTLN